MVKTKFERLDVGIPGVAAFRIEGKLGFHENTKIQRLVDECVKREFGTVIFDFSELSSLGGGVAKILRDFADAKRSSGGRVSFVVTNDIITQFLQDGANPMVIHRSFAHALAAAAADAPQTNASGAAAPARPAAGDGEAAGKGAEPEISPHGGVICMPYDETANRSGAARGEGAGEAAGDVRPPDRAAEPAKDDQSAREAEAPDSDTEEIIGEIFGSRGRLPTEPSTGPAPAVPIESKRSVNEAAVGELNRQLKRRILELKTLFSISSDFNAIRDRKKLLDIFLLTSIAEGGVESAAFLENRGESFNPIMSKGMEPESLDRLKIPSGAFAVTAGENNVFPIDSFALEPSWRDAVKQEGVEHVCPFRTKDGLAGIVLLGKRIAGRGMKEEDFEFLRILLNVAQGAYDNALMFEREHERTLGIVKTLISIIEENTLLKGTSEIVSRYVGMVAKSMDYPEEHFKDLIYATVLRDMGMVKVSDLILRSPRDLTKDEWEIIKRHPEDGAEMLSRMKFSDHVVNIVRTHHERFNGEGYPLALRGKEIPLGARIISVVESYAAMIHERPTRPALTEREALDTLRENYGLRYDREVVLQFARIMEKEIAQSIRSGVMVSP